MTATTQERLNSARTALEAIAGMHVGIGTKRSETLALCQAIAQVELGKSRDDFDLGTVLKSHIAAANLLMGNQQTEEACTDRNDTKRREILAYRVRVLSDIRYEAMTALQLHKKLTGDETEEAA